LQKDVLPADPAALRNALPRPFAFADHNDDDDGQQQFGWDW
jgi:hypothetical protein